MEHALLGLAIMYIAYRISRSYEKRRNIDSYHAIQMRIQRNEQVRYFRLRMINRFHVDALRCMPSYEEMLNSSKALEAKEWFNLDDLIVKETSARGLFEPISGTMYYHEN